MVPSLCCPAFRKARGGCRTQPRRFPPGCSATSAERLSPIYAPRRQPTADEVKKINDSLAAMERGMDPAPAPAPAPVASASKPKAPGGLDE